MIAGAGDAPPGGTDGAPALSTLAPGELDALLDGLPTSIVYRLELTRDGKHAYRYVSASIEPLTGLSREAVLADPSCWYAIVHPDDQPRLLAAEAKAMETLDRFNLNVTWMIDDEPRLFNVSARPTPQTNGSVLWDGVATDITDREALSTSQEAAERAEVALREVNHRVKNLFSLVPAIVQLSAQSTSDVGTLVDLIRDRVAALARAHTLTLNAFSQDHGIALDALIRSVLEPYGDKAGAFNLDGPVVRISSGSGNAMGLALHELATNAAKYGALGARKGRVTISWRLARREPDDETSELMLNLRWVEANGPVPVEKPASSGFGTKLIDRLIKAQGGTVLRHWRASGFAIDLTLPVPLEERS